MIRSTHRRIFLDAVVCEQARAYEQLSNFYEACAALEIDEYRNYEKVRVN